MVIGYIFLLRLSLYGPVTVVIPIGLTPDFRIRWHSNLIGPYTFQPRSTDGFGSLDAGAHLAQ